MIDPGPYRAQEFHVNEAPPLMDVWSLQPYFGGRGWLYFPLGTGVFVLSMLLDVSYVAGPNPDKPGLTHRTLQLLLPLVVVFLAQHRYVHRRDLFTTTPPVGWSFVVGDNTASNAFYLSAANLVTAGAAYLFSAPDVAFRSLHVAAVLATVMFLVGLRVQRYTPGVV